MAIDKSRADYEFQNLGQEYYGNPVFTVTGNYDGALVYNAGFECVRCSQFQPLRPCPNCNSKGFIPGVGAGGMAGIFCVRCQRGFTSWTCTSCQARNPVRGTIGQVIENFGGGGPGTGCLIATAALGGPEAPPVQELRELRDQLLRRTRWASRFLKSFERHYYSFSPAVAEAMMENEDMREVLGFSLVTPLLNYLHLVVRRPPLESTSLESADPTLKKYIEQMWDDMDAWLSKIPIPESYSELPGEDAAIEIALMLKLKLRSRSERLAYLARLIENGQLPLAITSDRVSEVRHILHSLGVANSEADQIVGEASGEGTVSS